jgi:hypothetical protein
MRSGILRTLELGARARSNDAHEIHRRSDVVSFHLIENLRSKILQNLTCKLHVFYKRLEPSEMEKNVIGTNPTAQRRRQRRYPANGHKI